MPDDQTDLIHCFRAFIQAASKAQASLRSMKTISKLFTSLRWSGRSAIAAKMERSALN